MADPGDVRTGDVLWAPAKSLWITAMFTGAVVGGSLTLSWSAVVVFVALTLLVLLLGHTLGSHRKLIHNSFACPRWLALALIACGIQVGLDGPLGLKRQHDLRDLAQRQPDCHPFLRHGRSFWVDAWWQLHCELRLPRPPTLPAAPHEPLLELMERTWRLQVLLTAVPLWCFGGWAFVWWGLCARVTAGVIGHWLVGYFAHNHGSQPVRLPAVAVQGRNLAGISLLTMGECWHNNHHADPASARLGWRSGEWDPGWWMLCGLARLGWVWDLRAPRFTAAATADTQAPLAEEIR